MRIIGTLLDKLLFAVLLIAFLQVPVLSDHYIQYLSGYLSASQKQVDQLQQLANNNRFRSAQALIDSLLQNEQQVVREDAINKQQLLNDHQQLQADIQQLTSANYFNQLRYLLNPRQYSTLLKVLDNFKPGIPLNVFDVLVALGLSLLSSLLIGFPFRRKRASEKFNSRGTAS